MGLKKDVLKLRVKHTIIIGVIGNDIHVVANRILARGLREAGYEVCNLGVNASPSDFVAASKEFEASAVVVSSVNGEGEAWVNGLPQLITNALGDDVVLYVGGNLAMGDSTREMVESRYLDLGFNRAYHRPSSLNILLTDLARDLVIV
jgi:methylaspartate mutase sigma subunit